MNTCMKAAPPTHIQLLVTGLSDRNIAETCHPREPFRPFVFWPSHLTAGTSCDSVHVLPYVFNQWGSSEVVLWRLIAEALSCRAGVALSQRPPTAISSRRSRTRRARARGTARRCVNAGSARHLRRAANVDATPCPSPQVCCRGWQWRSTNRHHDRVLYSP
jgi:hypothetical protein